MKPSLVFSACITMSSISRCSNVSPFVLSSEHVLEAAVVGLEDGVFGAEWEVAFQGILKATASAPQ